MTIKSIKNLLAGISVFAILAAPSVSMAMDSNMDGSSLAITPSTGTLTVGTDLVVSVVETGNDVNVVSLKLNYDQTKLSCQNIGSSDFQEEVVSKCENGIVEISRYVTPGQLAFCGLHVVSTITFRALSVGTTALTFTDPQVIAHGYNTLTSYSGGSYDITEPGGHGAGGTDSNSGSGNGSAPVITVGSASQATTSNSLSSVAGAYTGSYNGVYNIDTGNSEPLATDTSGNSASSTNKDSAKKEDTKNDSQKTNDADRDNDKDDDKNKSKTGAKVLAALAILAIAAGTIAAGRARAAHEADLAAAAAAAKAKNKGTKKKVSSAAKKKPARKRS